MVFKSDFIVSSLCYIGFFLFPFYGKKTMGGMLVGKSKFLMIS